MRYLRPVRIDEGKPSKRTKLLRAKETASLKARGHLDSTGPHEMGIAANNARKTGDTAEFKRLIALARDKKASMRTPRAPAKTARERYTLAGLQPQNSSVIPLTLPNIMEINIVRGPDGKPRLASGNGTTLRTNRGPRVKSAMDILNRGEKLTTAGAKSFHNAKISMGNKRALEPSKFEGERHRTSVRKRSRPSSGGLGGNYKNVDMARDSAENKFT
jgi:hypothetical protein